MQGIQTHISPQDLPWPGTIPADCLPPCGQGSPVDGSLCSPLFLCTGPFGMGASPLAQVQRGLFPCTHFGSPGCHCRSQPPPPSRKFGTTYCASFLNQFSFCGLFVCLFFKFFWGGGEFYFLMLRDISKLFLRNTFCPAFRLRGLVS